MSWFRLHVIWANSDESNPHAQETSHQRSCSGAPNGKPGTMDFRFYLFYDYAKWMNMWMNIIGPLSVTRFTTYLDLDLVTDAINLHHCTISIQVMMTFGLGITYAYSLFYPPHSHQLFLYMKLSIRFLNTLELWPHHPVGEGKLSIGLSLRLNYSSPNMMTT